MEIFEILAVVFFIFGICVGSFCNVLIYRLPRGESVNFPASHCQSCNSPLKFYHNVPIFSWLFLRGRCAFCKEKISFQYPLIEFFSGVLALVSLFTECGAIWSDGEILTAQSVFNAVVLALCFISLLSLSIIDLRYKAVPDALLYAATLFALAYAGGAVFWGGEWDALLNAGYFALGFWLLRAGVSLAMKREAMGSADIFIAAVIGAILPWKLALAAIYIAAILTLPAYAAVQKKGYELAFVPFLAAGLFITYVFKAQIFSLLGSLL